MYVCIPMHAYIHTVQLNSKLTLECRDLRVIFDLSRITDQNTCKSQVTRVFSRAREFVESRVEYFRVLSGALIISNPV